MSSAYAAEVASSSSRPSITSSHATQTSDDLFSLRNKTVAITGGARGLGITIAQAVVSAGGNAACLDILPSPSPEEWNILQQSAKDRNCFVSYRRCDVTDESAVASVFDEIATESTRNDAAFYGVVACAGIQQIMTAINYPAVDFERIMRVNVTGSFLTAKHAARKMIEGNVKGSVVLIASMSGQIANRSLTCTAYNSSKAAVQQMARSLAQEWGAHGIRVNTLSPGYIRTAMTDELLAAEPEIEKVWMAGALMNRLGVPEDFKAPALFLLAPGNSFMTGADLRVDGGHCAAA